MKYLILIAIIAVLMQSCGKTYYNGMYRGRGESKNCHAWRMAAMRTNGPIQ